jgi:hypothetical protein
MGRHSFRENSELFWNPIMRELGGWSKRSRVMNVHNSRTFLAPVLAIILFAGAPSFAEEPPCPKPDPLRLSVMLMAPPCDDCEQTTAELGELVKLQNLRTPDQAKHAKDDHEKTIGRFLHEVGIQIDDQLPVAGPFFKCIADAAKDEIRDAKTTFHRFKLTTNCPSLAPSSNASRTQLKMKFGTRKRHFIVHVLTNFQIMSFSF